MRLRRVKKDPDAERAVREAQQHLAQVKARDPEVHRVAEESKKLRRENHFAQDLMTIFQGGAR